MSLTHGLGVLCAQKGSLIWLNFWPRSLSEDRFQFRKAHLRKNPKEHLDRGCHPGCLWGCASWRWDTPLAAQHERCGQALSGGGCRTGAESCLPPRNAQPTLPALGTASRILRPSTQRGSVALSPLTGWTLRTDTRGRGQQQPAALLEGHRHVLHISVPAKTDILPE